MSNSSIVIHTVRPQLHAILRHLSSSSSVDATVAVLTLKSLENAHAPHYMHITKGLLQTSLYVHF